MPINRNFTLGRSFSVEKSDGSNIYYEDFNNSLPPNSFGENGEIAIDITTNEIYVKINNIWTKTGISNTIANITIDLNTKQNLNEKGQPNGYASLDETGKLPLPQLPPTDVSILRNASEVTVVSSTGADGNILSADTSFSGVMSASDKAKLNSIQNGATANSTDAQLRDRSTHTGIQPISSIENLQTALDSKENKNKFRCGIINGIDFTGSPKIYNVIFLTAMNSINYVISIVGEDVRVWSYSNKTINGFRIHSNSSVALTGQICWEAKEI